MSSFFLTTAEAQRYLESRIHFHPMVVSKVVNYLALKNPLELILDVGCGTGHSTIAFAAHAKKIVGVDCSPAMLAVALKGDNVRYEVLPAEKIDELGLMPDMITAGQSFHWFERRVFLGKCQQILKPGGTLIIFNHSLHHPELDLFDHDFPQPFPTKKMFKEEAEILGLRQLLMSTEQETIELTKSAILGHLRTLSSVEKEFQRDPTEAARKLDRYFSHAKPNNVFKLTSSSQVWILQKS